MWTISRWSAGRAKSSTLPAIATIGKRRSSCMVAEVGHQPRQRGRLGARDGDHVEVEVDAEHVDPPAGQLDGHPARAAARAQDRAGAERGDQVRFTVHDLPAAAMRAQRDSYSSRSTSRRHAAHRSDTSAPGSSPPLEEVMQGADPRMAGGFAVTVDPRAIAVVAVGVEQHRAEAGGQRARTSITTESPT